MLAEQRIAAAQDRGPVGLVLRLDRQIALGIEAHRTVAQVG